MSNRKDLMYPQEYTDKDGNKKTSWLRCGTLLEHDGKTKVKLEALPINFNGWLQAFEPRTKDAKPKKEAAKPKKGEVADPDDDIPF